MVGTERREGADTTGLPDFDVELVAPAEIELEKEGRCWSRLGSDDMRPEKSFGSFRDVVGTESGDTPLDLVSAGLGLDGVVGEWCAGGGDEFSLWVLGVGSSSCVVVGRGGTSEEGSGLLGRDLERDREDLRLTIAAGIAHRFWSIFFGVAGLTMAGGREAEGPLPI